MIYSSRRDLASYPAIQALQNSDFHTHTGDTQLIHRNPYLPVLTLDGFIPIHSNSDSSHTVGSRYGPPP